jgi:hypothetical protein
VFVFKVPQPRKSQLKTSGSTEDGEFLDQLNDHQCLKKDTAPCYQIINHRMGETWSEMVMEFLMYRAFVCTTTPDRFETKGKLLSANYSAIFI